MDPRGKGVSDGRVAEIRRRLRVRSEQFAELNGAWKVARRTIALDANVLLDKNFGRFRPTRLRRAFKVGGWFEALRGSKILLTR